MRFVDTAPEQRRYLAAGRSLEIIEGWQTKLREYRNAVAQLARGMGAYPDQTLQTSDLRACALVFPKGASPRGWVLVSKWHPRAWRPHAKRTGHGAYRAVLRGDWEVSPIADLRTALVGHHIEDVVWVRTGESRRGGQVITRCGFQVSLEPLGDDWIIGVYDLEEVPHPPDAVRLKRSEYWARKEALDTTDTNAA